MKRIVLLFILLVFVLNVQAETISQSSFVNLGLAGFENAQASQTVCKDFLILKNLEENAPDFFSVLSLHVQFEPVASGDANLTVFLNDQPIPVAAIKASEFENEWVRIRLPNANLLEQNRVEICLSNSNSTTHTVLLSDSLFGTYKLAEFLQSNFVKTVSENNPVLGQTFDATIFVHNSGSAPAKVTVLYKKPEVTFKHLSFVKGQTSFDGTIAPKQTISFSYSLKPKKTGPLTLPAAILSYQNEFGETKQVVSNYPLINVVLPDIKITAVMLNKSTEKKLLVGKPIPLQIILTNYGNNTISNVSVILPQESGLSFGEQQNLLVESIAAGETKTVELTATPLQKGSFEAGCRLAYLDLEVEGTTCESSRFFVEEPAFPIEFAGAIVFLVLAVLVYLFFHNRSVASS